MSAEDLRDAIEELGRPYVLRRPGPVAMVGGYPEPPTETTHDAVMVVTPIKAAELHLLPEGARTSGGAKFSSTAEVRVGDRFEWRSATWAVHVAEDYSELGQYWAGFAVREES